jgi:hypothetical protein
MCKHWIDINSRTFDNKLQYWIELNCVKSFYKTYKETYFWHFTLSYYFALKVAAYFTWLIQFSLNDFPKRWLFLLSLCSAYPDIAAGFYYLRSAVNAAEMVTVLQQKWEKLNLILLTLFRESSICSDPNIVVNGLQFENHIW